MVFAAPVQMDATGWGRIRYPWRSVSDSLLIVTNLSDDEAAVVGSRARHEPALPFDLMGLAARPTGSGLLHCKTTGVWRPLGRVG